MSESSGGYKGSLRALTQDTSISVFSSVLAFLAVRWMSDPIFGFTALLLKWACVSLIGTLLGIVLSGYHKTVRKYINFESASKILLGVLIKDAVLALSLIIGIVKLPSVVLCVVAVLGDFLITLFLLLYIRRAYEEFRREEGEVRDRASRKTALILGTGDEAVRMAGELQGEGEYDVVGYITDDPKMDGFLIGSRMVYCCRTKENLTNLRWRLGGIDCVFFADDGDNSGGGDANANRAGLASTGHERQMTKAGDAVKRLFDVTVSGIFMILFSPLLIICSLAIKLEDGGPVFFRQARIGQNGEPFEILKFRSMRTDAEKNGAELAHGEADTRLTKVGRFLRAHHLDELPQLWNVFVGDMSFVGYRPERKIFIEKILARNPRYSYLYQIKPGVTSFATLYNGYTDTLEKMLVRLDLDLYYLRRRSLWFDLKIMGLTFLSVFTGKKF